MRTEYFRQSLKQKAMTDGISVKQLNLYVKSLLESNARLNMLTVTGEISNFKNHYASGHWYFTLKDSEASVRCVMFRGNAVRVSAVPQDGMRVTLRGRVSLYEKDGQYQFYAESLTVVGGGDLAAKFREVKERLEAEGLFDTASKRKLSAYPKKIAVITSDTGAAIQDIINITSRRYPLCELLICPVAVQGIRAVPEMIGALEKVCLRDDVDTIIIGRGGGSEEDLAAFNDEALARKIYESPIPVISAVGHETDFSISDFVADLRAPTPSAAAELAVPDAAELKEKIKRAERRCAAALKSRVEYYNARTDRFNVLFSAGRISDYFNARHQYIDDFTDSITSNAVNAINSKSMRLSRETARLDALSPLKILSRGYAAVSREGKTVKSAAELKPDETVFVRFSDGTAQCRVASVSDNGLIEREK